MATLKILGACSGTEPIKNLHHTSLVLTVNDCNYFFDAGENCSHTAHVEGVNLLKTRAVFISHSHYDHIGGLMGLFWNIRKISSRTKKPVESDIKLFLPQPSVWDNISQVLRFTEGGFKKDFEIIVDTPTLGAFYQDELVKVSAFESYHLPKVDDKICSYSYLIETCGKKIVYSGDVKSVEELSAMLKDGCDVLLCETGHHSVKSVCDFAENNGVKKLIFIHHGREILEDRPTVKEAISNCKISVEIAFDGMDVDVKE